jgi:hypothetical protein
VHDRRIVVRTLSHSYIGTGDYSLYRYRGLLFSALIRGCNFFFQPGTLDTHDDIICCFLFRFVRSLAKMRKEYKIINLSKMQKIQSHPPFLIYLDKDRYCQH